MPRQPDRVRPGVLFRDLNGNLARVLKRREPSRCDDIKWHCEAVLSIHDRPILPPTPLLYGHEFIRANLLGPTSTRLARKLLRDAAKAPAVPTPPAAAAAAPSIHARLGVIVNDFRAIKLRLEDADTLLRSHDLDLLRLAAVSIYHRLRDLEQDTRPA